jgi:hypothetical protein
MGFFSRLFIPRSVRRAWVSWCQRAGGCATECTAYSVDDSGGIKFLVQSY